MSFKAILTIDGKKFNLWQVSYKFSRYVDQTGYCSNIIRFEPIHLLMPSSGSIFFLDWLSTPALQKSGSISFYEDEDQIRKVKQVLFAGAFCMSYKEVYNSSSSLPMCTTLTISAGGIKIEDCEFKFPWFKGTIVSKSISPIAETIEYLANTSTSPNPQISTNSNATPAPIEYINGQVVPVKLDNIDFKNYSSNYEDCILHDKVSGAIFAWITMPNDERHGPELTLKPKNAWLTTDKGRLEVKLEAVEKYSWTAVALKKVIDKFEDKHGVKPPCLPGSLAWENLSHFQKEYFLIFQSNPSLTPEEVAHQAIRKISFGWHRINEKYGNFDVSTKGETTVVIDGILCENVPRIVDVIAYPSE